MADVDTENLRTSKITDFGFRGIPKIMIPKTDDDFRSSDLGASILKKYLPICRIGYFAINHYSSLKQRILDIWFL